MHSTAASKSSSCFKKIVLFWAFWQGILFFGLYESGAVAGNILKIGMLEEPKTLNVWRGSGRWTRKVLGRIYHPLYVREPKDLKLVPWLAEALPVYDAATLTYTIKLRPAQWSDGSEFTSEDVVFTGNLIKEFKFPRNYSRWAFIEKIEAVDKHTVRFCLSTPKAIFLGRTTSTPIVQKKKWEKIAQKARGAEKPLAYLLNYDVEHPVGMGPFVLKEWKRGGYVYLQKNEHFFGKGKEIGGYTLGPHVDGILFKIFGTSDAAILALKKGSIDMFWWGIQAGYLQDLREQKGVEIFKNEEGGIYYLGFNLRRKPFNDVHFRHAVAFLTDKNFIISRVLQGYAVETYSIVPPGNTLWTCTDVPGYGEGLSREARIRKAYEILSKAGYTWEAPPVDASGEVVKGEKIRLPDGTPMEKFTILTPPADYDPNRAMAGQLIQEWLRMAGIPAISKPTSFGSLLQQVKDRHQFDLFILGYSTLDLDPDYLRSFFDSKNDKIRGWNTSGYRDPEFDRLAQESTTAMDEQKRKELICKMQQLISRDIPWFPLYDPMEVEAVRKDKFTGWVGMLGGIGNRWSFCRVMPN
jgi:peptide/nickel transport system substrate-binding protein